MKRIILILTAVLLAAALLIVGGCDAAGDSAAETDGIVVGYSTPSLQNSFWISVTNGMQNKADELGITLEVRDAESDTAQQTADIEDLVQQSVDVLLITPYDSVSLAPAIKIANKAGIPVIIVDIGINDPEVVFESLIITDNYTGGRIAGEWLVGYIEENSIENATVGTIEAQLGAENARERHRGFIDVMEENGVNVVLGSSANSLRDEAMTVMEDFLQAYPDLTAVFAECDDMALGALQAVKQAHADTIIVGYDGNIAACEAIEDNTQLKADVDQQPYVMGALAVEMARDLMLGKAVDEEIKIIPLLITEDDVDSFIKNHYENNH